MEIYDNMQLHFDLAKVLNYHGIDTKLNTQDLKLATFLLFCLENYELIDSKYATKEKPKPIPTKDLDWEDFQEMKERRESTPPPPVVIDSPLPNKSEAQHREEMNQFHRDYKAQKDW